MSFEHPLPSQARFLREQALREEQEGIHWRSDFPGPLRARLVEAFKSAFSSQSRSHTDLIDAEIYRIHQVYSYGARGVSGFEEVVDGFTSGSDEQVLDMLDAASVALDRLAADTAGQVWYDEPFSGEFRFDGGAFREDANAALLMFRHDHKFIGGRLLPRTAEELHRAVVLPLEAVLTDDPRFSRANTSYEQAIRQLRDGHFGASVTSAGSVLHEVLVGLGARGNDLTALFADARKKSLLAGYDGQVLQAFQNIGNWVNGERSNRGNAHGAATADVNDAWLAIHLVGALVVRLITGTSRSLAIE